MISVYESGALMSASSTAPLKRAPIGPILISTVATMRVSDSLVSDWQPGMQRRSTSGSLSACQTLSRAAAIRCSPDIFIDTFSWLTRLADEPRRRTLAALRASVSGVRSEEHTSELQSLMRISYAVFCLKQKKKKVSETYEYQRNSQ